MQHGYDHKVKIKSKGRIGEFGGRRTYNEQLNDIRAGKELMEKYFKNLWIPAFNYPFGPYNYQSMQALSYCGFKIVNSHFNSHWTRRLLYRVGHLLKKGRLFGYHISWNLHIYPRTSLFEIDINLSFIKKYFGDRVEDGCEFQTLDEMKKDTMRYINFNTIGVVLHHGYHSNLSGMDVVKQYLQWCSQHPNIEYARMIDIYERFNGR